MNTVTVFPEFRKFSFDDRSWYEDFYKELPNYADFTFNNLIVWQDQYNDLAVSRIDSMLIFRCTSLYMENQLMINFIGHGDYDTALEMIFDYMNKQGQHQVVLGLPEFIVEQLAYKDRYVITDDRDNAEYIIDTNLLGGLVGPEMKRMRQLVNGYERENGSVTIVELDLKDPEQVEFLRSELFKWEHAFNTNETAGQEKAVILRTLEVAGDLDYGNLSLLVDGRLAGFALYRHIPSRDNDTVVVNHLKTNYSHMHSSYYLTHRLAQALAAKNYRYMNYEQDLGIEGLRTFKQRLKPADLLRKYNVTSQ